MAFSAAQIRKLNAAIRRQHVKERQVEGKILHYVEGWHVIAEANRIFGFDAWDRETISSQCVFQKQIDRAFVAAYLTRIRITVRAGGATVFREGLGSGEATAPTSGQAHEWASKAAETDATKRALSTFGNSFGLSLYRGKPGPFRERKTRSEPSQAGSPDRSVSERPEAERPVAYLPVHLPPPVPDAPQRVDKSELAMPEPKRLRDQGHLRYVAQQPCLVCGRAPSQAHHLRFAQPRAMARKVSDEFTVPLCAIHHHELHMRGNELAWWIDRNVDPLPIAADLWRSNRSHEHPDVYDLRYHRFASTGEG